VENEYIRLQTEYDGLLKRDNELQKCYFEAQTRIMTLEKNSVQMEWQLQIAKDALICAEDKASVLENEKQLLEQERAQRSKTFTRKVEQDEGA